MSFPRYKSYKESGVEWLGEVPSHWSVRRLMSVAGLNPSKNEVADLSDATELSFLPMEAIGEDGSLDLSRTRPVGEVRNGYSYFADGDVVFAKVTPCLENGKGALMRGLQGGRGFGTTELTVIRPHHAADAAFLWWLTASRVFRGPAEGEMIGAGGLKRVPDEFVADFRIGWPPQSERVAITTFLHQETAKIDALVEAQRRLIALLKEKRQAVISHAVTKGLDPGAPMKPSGVEWLGDVPAHWMVLPLGRVITRIEQGWSPKAHERSPDPGEASVLRLSAIKNGRFQADERKALPDLAEAELLTAPLVRAGDFLLTRANTPELVGDCAIASGVTATIFSDLIYRLSFQPSVSPEFMLLVLRSHPARGQIRRDARGSSMSMAKLSHGHLKGWIVALPPEAEQETIVQEVSRIVSRLESLTRTAEAAIDLLKERCAALISAAVTGKIDVRGWTKMDVRDAVAAEIIHFNAQGRGLHRVKFQKLLYLAQTYAGIEEIDGRFQRYAAGPHDGDLVTSVEDALKAAGVMTVSQTGGVGSEVTYRAKSGTRPDRARLASMLGDRLPKLDHLLSTLASEDMHGAEAVATLYAVWNDALLAGETPDDARLVRGFLDEWHEEKRKKFRRDDVMHRIGFLQRNGLTPEGRGRSTLGDRLL